MHAVQTLILIDGDVEAACQEAREVIACHLKQQLVLVYGVGLIGQDKQEAFVACGTQRVGSCGVGSHRDVSSRPDIADVKLAAVEPASFLYALDDHTSQFTDLTLWVLLHHLFHALQTAVAVTIVQACHTVNEYELRAVGT